MGDFEVILGFFWAFSVGTLIYNIFINTHLLNFYQRFGFSKPFFKEFYECGLRTKLQRPVPMPIHFLLICIFFILYDVEFIFLFPFVAGLTYISLLDLLLLLFFFFLILISYFVDLDRHTLYWKY